MANLPRFLPLVFVAIGGVLAMKAVSSVDSMPDMLKSARAAFAEEAAPAEKKPAKAVAKTPDAKTAEAKAAGEGADAATAEAPNAMSVMDMATPAATVAPAPVCATSINDLAKQAGMSPSELQVLQSLGTRRTQLDAREKQVASQEALIQAADAKLDGRIKQMEALKGQIQALLDQANKGADDDTARMIKVYEAMKPKDAARVLETMRDDVRLPIAAKMKERSLAAVLAQMTPNGAKELTEKLAMRMKQSEDIQSKLNQMAAKPATPPQTQPSQTQARK
jgi:flagellar motility protein MotE (MotC chaperone)